MVALVAVWGAAFGAASEHPMSEAQFRTEMGFPASQEILYRATDGSPIDYAEFGKRVQAGGTFAMEKTASGVVSLWLKSGSAASPSKPLPDLLPPLNLTTIDGRALRSADFADRPLLLSFFFCECVPCIRDVAILNAFASKHPEYHYLAVTFDSGADAAHFVQQHHLNWPVVADAQRFISAAGVATYPAYVLVSTQGRIVARGSGLDARVAADPALGLKLLEQWMAAPR